MEAIGELDRKAALTPELARLWFVRGTLAHKLQDPDTARQAFERVWQGYPPLADYAAWEMVQYDAARDLLPTLQKTVTTLAERYPFSRLLPESRLVLARTQHRLGQSAPARAASNAWCATPRSSPSTLKRWLSSARYTKTVVSSTWRPRSCSAWVRHIPVTSRRPWPCVIAVNSWPACQRRRDRQIRSSSSPVLTVWRRDNSGRKLRHA